MDADPDHYEVIDLVKFTIAVQEVRLLYDHDVGTRIIYDAKGVTLRHMMKWNPLILTRLSTLVEVLNVLKIRHSLLIFTDFRKLIRLESSG
jgi:hypothetical protein